MGVEVQQVASWSVPCFAYLSQAAFDPGKLDAGLTNESLGSGEFLLVKQGSDEVKMVVRTINSSAFSQHDWDEYVVTVSPTYPAAFSAFHLCSLMPWNSS